jgi:hypothetical protein
LRFRNQDKTTALVHSSNRAAVANKTSKPQQQTALAVVLRFLKMEAGKGQCRVFHLLWKNDGKYDLALVHLLLGIPCATGGSCGAQGAGGGVPRQHQTHPS